MGWLIAIVCIVLIIIFWRIFVPIAVIAAVGLGLLLLYWQGEGKKSWIISQNVHGVFT